MNAGLSNLDTLKKHLLANTLAGNPQFDLVIQAIGLGMAAGFEQYCNRKFARLIGAQDVLPGDRVNYLLSRYPLEALTTVELKLDEADGYVVQTSDFVNTVDLKNGMVLLPNEADPGDELSQVRFTYTGGFWWEPLEPDDAAYPSALPAGANALPDDLKLAWLLQCQQVWDARDQIGLSLVDAPGTQQTIDTLKLSPLVKTMIAPYVRYQMV